MGPDAGAGEIDGDFEAFGLVFQRSFRAVAHGDRAEPIVDLTTVKWLADLVKRSGAVRFSRGADRTVRADQLASDVVRRRRPSATRGA